MAAFSNSAPPVERFPVTEYTLFYEVVEGNLVRNMQPIEIAVHRFGGDGPGLVLLHSLTGASGTMMALADALVSRFTVVGVDLRGFGSSHRPTLEYAVATWTDDLSTVLAEVALSEVSVYGHGVGACIAVEALERGLVGAAAISGVAFGPGEPAVLDAVVAVGDAGESVESLLADISGCEVTGADLTSPVVPRAVRAWQAYGGPADPTPFRASLLVLAGTRDTFTPPAAPGGASALAAEAGVRLVSLAAGHDLPRERPNEVAAALTSFLDDRR